MTIKIWDPTAATYDAEATDPELLAADPAFTGTFPQVFNVTGYGAVGDGTTDDTAAVHAAIAAAGAAGGGIVFLPGDHACGNVLLDADRVHLVGAGRHGSAIKAKAGHAGILVDVTGSYCSVRDLTLNGEELGTDCLRITDGAVRFVGHNLYVMDAGQVGINAVGAAAECHGSQWTNIKVLNCGTYGVKVGAFAYDSQWSNLWVGQCNIGLRVESGEHSFSNFHLWGNTSDGLEVRSDYNRFTNGYLETNGGLGADLFDAEGNAFQGCEFRTNGSFGVALSGTSHRNRFVGCIAYNNIFDGFRVTAGDMNQFVGCNAFDNQGTKTQDYGIRIMAGATSNVVTGCVARAADNVSGGILDGGTTSVVANNVT